MLCRMCAHNCTTRLCVSSRNRSVDFSLIIANIKVEMCPLINWVGTANDNDNEWPKWKTKCAEHDISRSREYSRLGSTMLFRKHKQGNQSTLCIHIAFVHLACISFRIVHTFLLDPTNKKASEPMHIMGVWIRICNNTDLNCSSLYTWSTALAACTLALHFFVRLHCFHYLFHFSLSTPFFGSFEVEAIGFASCFPISVRCVQDHW